MSKLTGVFGGLALSALVGAGIASADVLSEQAIDTTCNYDQVVRALDARNPGAGQKLNNSFASGWLKNYLVQPHDQRVVLAQQAQTQYAAVAGKYISDINAVAATCNGF